ncbi:hypothetical protein NQZ68_009403 [Dissostichus eleginoides]|nr:hypothetical protein NQZ68_009403 [Dissostichus eleginoides]
MSSCIFEWDKDDISHLKEAKSSELKKKHAGQAPSEAQVLANISSSELAKHCRRRTRGIEESRALIQDLLKSMWELTDTSGLRLINPESMACVWEVQQKHLPCIQDPPGVELYTKVGSGLQKGSKVLDILRCGRGSSSVESFHRHQNTFIPGERIAVEYLLAQSDRGDLLGPQQHSELGTIQVQEEECLDITISDAVEILSQRPSEVDTSAPRCVFPLPVSHNTSPHTSSQNTRCDSRGVEGWEAVDDLAKLFMTHGQAALRPDANRICECVSLRLLKEFELARNRPKDSKGYKKDKKEPVGTHCSKECSFPKRQRQLRIPCHYQGSFLLNLCSMDMLA